MPSSQPSSNRLPNYQWLVDRDRGEVLTLCVGLPAIVVIGQLFSEQLSGQPSSMFLALVAPQIASLDGLVLIEEPIPLRVVTHSSTASFHFRWAKLARRPFPCLARRSRAQCCTDRGAKGDSELVRDAAAAGSRCREPLWRHGHTTGDLHFGASAGNGRNVPTL
jgi:hypothetical protein